MQNLLNDLKELLKQDDRLMVEDELLKNKIIELALKLDENLIRLLLSHSRLRQHFFADIDGVLVFDKEKFLQFVSNKAFLPDSYTAFKNKIGLTDDGGATYLSRRREVVLTWPYRDCVLEGGQTEEDAKRDEIFWNETLAPDDIDRLLDPKVLTNFRRIDADGEHPVKEVADTDNLIIRGNNLLALHSLLPRLRGQVKLIYIDPPFNIGGDSFGYNDRFNHSTWLTFMMNRLEVAQHLLAPDGCIFVHIDYHEVGYLITLMDEIFDKANFIQLISVKTASPAGFKTVNPGPIDVTEYLLFYTKNREVFNFKKCYVPVDYDSNYDLVIENQEDDPAQWRLIPLRDIVYRENGIDIGNTPQQSARNAKEKWGPFWRVIRERMMAEWALQNHDRVVSIRDPHKPTASLRKLLKKSQAERGRIFTYEKSDNSESSRGYVINGGMLAFYSDKVRAIDGFLTPTELLTDLWTDISWDGIAKEGGVTLKNGKKPEKLIKRIIEIATDCENDIVLDFNLGSGTTAAVAHKMGRQYIGIEQLDYGENDSIVRLKNVIGGDQSGISKAVGWQGGGSFVTCDLMQWNARHVEQIQATQSTEELQTLWKTLQAEGFLSYKVDFAQFNEHAEEFAQLSLADQKRFLLEVLDKNQLYVNLSEIDDADYQVSEEDKRLNRQFYNTEQN